MPSILTTLTSGTGLPLISGNIFSGTIFPAGGVNIFHSASGIGPIYIGLPDASGNLPTMLSGTGAPSLTDAMEVGRGFSYFVPVSRLHLSGSLTGQPDVSAIRYHSPAASSGTRIFFDFDTRY